MSTSSACKRYRATDKYTKYLRAYLARTKEHRRVLSIKRRRSFEGKIKTSYESMRSRTKGKATKNSHLYIDLPLCTAKDFFNWSFNNEEYKILHAAWVISDYCMPLAPSVDRIDTTKGYTLDNI